MKYFIADAGPDDVDFEGIVGRFQGLKLANNVGGMRIRPQRR